MPNIDERIVELQFDNHDFEQKTKETRAQLQDLDNALNFKNSNKGFDAISEAAKKADLSPLASSAETVMAKFSAMQVVAYSAINHITGTVMNAAHKLISFIPHQIWSGGWTRAENLEQAQFQIKGLKASWEDLYDDISYAVDGTAYGLDSAAKVASQLTASGVKAGDQMKASLRGISGVAAMTNSTYDDIGRIFTTVAGNGRLMGEQLLQLSSRGINAAATLAAQLHVTEAEVRDMVSKGKIDFDTFAKAMDDAFGEHAKDANETFSGALSNVKSALSRIGAEIATPLMENMIPVLNSIRILINNIKTSLAPIFENISELFESSSKSAVKFIDSLARHANLKPFIDADDWSKAGVVSKEFQDSIIEAAKAHGVAIDEMIKEEGSFKDTLKNGWLSKDILDDAVKSLGDLDEQSVSTRKAISSFTQALGSIDKISTLELFIRSFEQVYARFKTILQIMKSAFEDAFSIKLDSNPIRVFAENLYEMAKSINMTRDFISGLRTIFEGFFSAISLIAKTIGTVGSVFYSVFSSIMSIFSPFGVLIFDVVKEFSAFVTELDLMVSSSEWLTKTLEGLKNAFKMFGEDGHNAVSKFVSDIREAEIIPRFFDKLFEAISIITPKIQLFVNSLSSVGYAILDFAKKIGSQALQAISNFLGISESASSSFLSIFSSIENGGSIVGAVITFIAELFSSFFNILSTGINSVTSFADGFKKSMEGIGSASESVSSKFAPLIDSIQDVKDILIEGNDVRASNLSKMMDNMAMIGAALSDILKNVFGYLKTVNLSDVFRDLLDVLMTGALIKGVASISRLTSNLNNLVFAIKRVPDAFTGWQADTNPNKLLKIAAAIAILAAALFLLSSIEPEKMKMALEGVAAGLIMLIGAMEIMDNVFSKGTGKALVRMSDMAVIMILLAVSVGILALAIKRLESCDWESIAKAGVVIGMLVGAIAGLSKLSGGVLRASFAMTEIAIAILLLTIPIKILGSMDTDELVQGLASLAAMLIGLVAALHGMSDLKLGSSAIQLIGLAIALNLLIRPIKQLGEMNSSNLIQGLIGLAVTIGFLVGSLAILGKINVNSAVIQMLGLAVALNMLIDPIQTLGSMNRDELIQGLAALAAMLIGFTAALSGLNDVKSGSAAVGILAIAVALNMLMGPIQQLGEMAKGDLVQGLLGIFGALSAILVPLGLFLAALNKMSTVTTGKMLAVVPIFLAVSVAIMALTLAISTLAQLNPGQMAVALIGLAAGLAIVIGAMYIAGTLASVLAPGVAILFAFGAAIALVGAGVFLFSAGLMTLITALAAGVTGIIALRDSLNSVLQPLTDLIAAFVVNFVKSFSEIAGEVGTSLVTGFVDMFSSLAEGIRTEAPVIIEAFGGMLGSLVDSLIPKIPEFLQKGVEFVTALIDGLGSQASTLAQSAVNLAVDLINALADALENNGAQLREACNHLVQSIIDFLIEFITGKNQELDSSGKTIGENIVDGIANGINEFASHALNAISKFATDIIDKAKGLLGINSPSTVFQEMGENSMEGYKVGIESGSSGPISAIGDFVSNVIDTVANSPIAQAVGGFVTTFTTGLQSLKDEPVATIQNGIQGMIGAAQSFSSNFLNIGSGVGSQIASGLKSSSNQSISEITTITQGMISSLNNAKSGIQSISQSIGVSIVTGVRSQLGASKAAIQSIVSGMISALNSGRGAFSSAGRSLSSNFVVGIRANSSSARSAASSLSASAASGARGSYGSFYSAGANLAAGFANGISANSYMAVARAAAMAESAARAARSALHEKSPSKLLFKYGAWFTEGFALGIESLIPRAEGAADDMAKGPANVVEQLSNAIDAAMDADFDYNPVITPVVDLSEVDKATSYMNGAFGSNYALGSLGALVPSMNRYSDTMANNKMYNVSIELNYDSTADADAIQLVDDIATGLEAKLNLEAR